ncbi:Late embryogenesis abundant protein [Parasponia andersonii]|uniref:Late embryogenesis abundant protein n=1 Tax=Parasponia andersonii TaxID=3476 RepID=A0A2P5B109_PARAD|nr:Late embryogenesis abundant protein [Parasponia andersonii]
MAKIHPETTRTPQLPPLRGRPVTCGILFQVCCFVCAAVFALFVILFLGIESASRREIEVSVTDASLNNFTLLPMTDNTAFWIAYDMSFNITLQNPNTRIGIYYDLVDAYAYYAFRSFSAVSLEPFYQGHKTTKTLQVVFEGHSTMWDEYHPGFRGLYGEETRDGVYSIMLVLSLSVRTKYCNIKYRQDPPLVNCYLRVPLRSMEGKSHDATFEATPCDTLVIK